MIFNAKDRRLESEENLRSVQLTQLYILDVIDEICKANGIKYFLFAGTLLGCKRHAGFIPWDDDLDIGMTIEHYKKFVRMASRELPKGLFLQTPKTVPGCYAKFAKVIDLSSLVVEAITDVARPSGIFVDVFPVEKFPNFPCVIRRALSRALSLSWRRSRLHRVASHRYIAGIFYSGIKAFLWASMHGILRITMWISAKICPTILHLMPESGGVVSTRSEFTESIIYPLKTGKFEGKEYPVPAQTEKLLEIMYGDWRKLPPENERQGHHSSIMFPVQSMGFWWTYPHASLSEEDAAGIKRIPRYLVQV